jgi:hypothetical protein
MKKLLALLLLLAGCGGQMKESNQSVIANQAESLERAANATTDQMIMEIENSATADETIPAEDQPLSNGSQR